MVYKTKPFFFKLNLNQLPPSQPSSLICLLRPVKLHLPPHPRTPSDPPSATGREASACFSIGVRSRWLHLCGLSVVVTVLWSSASCLSFSIRSSSSMKVNDFVKEKLWWRWTEVDQQVSSSGEGEWKIRSKRMRGYVLGEWEITQR